MDLKTKIVGAAVGSVFVTAVVGVVIQRSVIRRQGIEAIRENMKSIVLGAENTRRSISAMRSLGMFDEAALLADAAKSGGNYQKWKIYQTVPVVAAWNSIADVAGKEGYEFRVPARNPRNKKNTPSAEEDRILGMLERSDVTDYFEVNDRTGEVIYARPITLTTDCLACHGDPATSRARNGKDVIGFPMEGWREGSHHGMFLLRSNLDRVNGVVGASINKTLLWVVPISLLMGVLVYLFLSRLSARLLAAVASLSGGAAQLKSVCAQISGGSQALARGVSAQAASVEETSASANQIHATTLKNAESVRLAAEEMNRVEGRIEDCNRALAEMTVSMNEIQSSSDEIAKIIRVIDEIAFQTNLLALNAAVEAARAGEAGAGFAVVADEVRNLAQRSAQAAKETAPLIEGAVTKSHAGAIKVDQVAELVRAVIGSTAVVKARVSEVSQGSQEQTIGIEQISRALAQISQVTQQSAASSEESAAAGEQLSTQAESLDRIASDLQAVVAG